MGTTVGWSGQNHIGRAAGRQSLGRKFSKRLNVLGTVLGPSTAVLTDPHH